MNARAARPFGSWFQRMSIQGKLVFAFGLQLTLVAGVAVGGLIGLRSVRRLFESAIEDGLKTERLAGQVRAELLEARRQEKDFLLGWRPLGFRRAYEQHVKLNQQHIAQLLGVLAQLEELGGARAGGETRTRILDDLVALKPYINVYAQDFGKAVELIGRGERAAGNLQGRSSDAISALEEQVGKPRSRDPLLRELRALRRREHEYLARTDERSREGLAEAVRGVRASWQQRQPAPPAEEAALIERYLGALAELIDLFREAEAKIDEFQQAAGIVEPLVADIATSGQGAAAIEIQAARAASRQAVVIMGAIFLLALLTGLGLARRLSRQIRTPLQTLARTAEAVGAGDLSARAEVDSQDEIGTLASTFNAMTGQLRTLIDSLEQRVLERKRAEEALRASQRRLQDVVDNSTAIIYLKDLEGRYRLVNRRLEEILARRKEEIIGRTDHDLFPAALADAFRENDRRALQSGRALEFEEVAPLPDGLHTYISVKTSLRDEAARPYAVCGISTDITERKQVEEQLRQSQKMEAIGRLAGGVAHDFNNLLTVINGFSGLMLGRMDRDNPFFGPVSEIAKSGDKAAALTRQLLAYSRKQRLEARCWNPNLIVSEIEAILRRLIGEDVALVCELEPEVGSVKVDRSQLEQILLNLAVNARDAMPQGGRLVIRTDNVDPHHPLADGPAGPLVLIAVSDTGCGMTEEVKARVFEPFFTTKEVGRGTGLGLSVVYGIVRQSGGTIAVESTVGLGTTFNIFLPRETSLGESAPEEAIAPPQPAHGQWKTILLVEDEESVRTFARVALEEGGYVVRAAASTREALAILQQTSPPFSLLVADLVMPDLGGRALVDHMRAAGKNLPVLFISGYAGPGHDSLVQGLKPGEHFLAKPFDGADLLRKVRQVLDADHPGAQSPGRKSGLRLDS
jgi:PAS domain S-box-containing protein